MQPGRTAGFGDPGNPRRACPARRSSGPAKGGVCGARPPESGSDRVEVLPLRAGLGAPLRCLDQREGLHLAVHLQRDHPGADDRGGDSDVARLAVREPDVDALKVRLEGATADSGALGADAAQVLRLAARAHVIAERRLLATDFTLASHRTGSSKASFAVLSDSDP